MGTNSKRNRRAILLLSVLLFAVIIAIYVQAAMMLGPASIGRSLANSALVTAGETARSGIDWVRNRIGSDPGWMANVSQTLSAPGLQVKEGAGQVEGWIQQSNGWSRFRIRFNYQDGPALATPNSDNLNDPPSLWTDFPYVSCNNLLGASPKSAPFARGPSYVSSGPWSTTQLTVPNNSILVSVEGASGPVTMSGGLPTGFSGRVHHRVAQAVLKFGLNQPVSDAAVMAAGDLNVATFAPAGLTLGSAGPQTSRLRSKGNLTVPNVAGGISSDLRHAGSITNGTLTGNVTTGPDAAADGFYQLPASKVKAPTGSLALNAGVYVITNSGTVEYHNLNYQDFATASPVPAGVPTTLPPGMTLVGPNPTPPKFRIDLSQDLKINAVGAVTDFALIPDGGAPQSAAYGGVPAATSTPAPPPSVSSPFLSYLGVPASAGILGTPVGGTLSPAQKTAWTNAVSGLSSFSILGHNVYNLPGGTWIALPIGGGPFRVGGGSGTDTNLATHLDGLLPTTYSSLTAAYPAYTPPAPSPSSSPSPSASPPPSSPSALLSPSDLELNMQGGSSGLVLGNDSGNIVVGAQIQGNGAALVSSKDIMLIGTSTDLSSTPGAGLGLNLYAQGTITIDAFKLDSSGVGSFQGINLKGVVYSWQGINVFAGNSTTSAPVSLTGTLVAYGGDPSGAPTPGTAGTSISASSVSITYDSSYVASLFNGGPYTLEVAAWHEF